MCPIFNSKIKGHIDVIDLNCFSYNHHIRLHLSNFVEFLKNIKRNFLRTLLTLLVLFAGLELGEKEGDAHGEEEDHHAHHVDEDSLAALRVVVPTVII